jgi:hypothetical protein
VSLPCFPSPLPHFIHFIKQISLSSFLTFLFIFIKPIYKSGWAGPCHCLYSILISPFQSSFLMGVTKSEFSTAAAGGRVVASGPGEKTVKI